MTKREAKSRLNLLLNEAKNPYHLIDAIYDKLESRTCENCKHYQYLSKENGGTSRNMPYYICLNENDIMPDADGGWLEPYKDFGCNQWESGND